MARPSCRHTCPYSAKGTSAQQINFPSGSFLTVCGRFVRPVKKSELSSAYKVLLICAGRQELWLCRRQASVSRTFRTVCVPRAVSEIFMFHIGILKDTEPP